MDVEYDSNWSRKTHTVDVIYPFGKQSNCRVFYHTMTYLRSADESKLWFLFLVLDTRYWILETGYWQNSFLQHLLRKQEQWPSKSRSKDKYIFK